jgi:hypothetical protein
MLLYALAVAMGYLPFPILAHSPLLLGLTVVVLTGAAFVTSEPATYSGPKPSKTEIVLALVGGGAMGAVSSVFSVVVLGVLRLIGLDSWWAVDALGIISIAFVALIILGAGPHVLTALYPQSSGIPSLFHRYATEPDDGLSAGARIGTLVAIALLVVVSGSILPLPELVTYLLALAAGVGGALLGGDYMSPWTATEQPAPEDALAAAKQLLEAAGFQVIPRPQVGEEGADSVIALLDFSALRSDRALAGQVRGRRRDSQALLNDAAGLESAVRLLQSRIQEQQKITVPMAPVLLVLDDDGEGVPKEILDALGELEIIHAPSARRISELARTDELGLRRLAKELFGQPIEAGVA